VAAVTTTTKAGTTTTVSPVVKASSGSLAFTGTGPGIGILGILGGALILLGFALLALVDAPRRAMSSLVFLGPATWRRMRDGDLAERLAILNPMRLRRARSEGVPDTSITETAPPEPMQLDTDGGAGYTSTRVRGAGDRFSRVPEVGRDLAQTTARRAVRTAQWLLGR
jgi:hypothetical protein